MNIFFDLLKTVCNPETPYNMYSIIETNYVSSGLLFIYFYYIRASSIAFFITVVISRVIQCIYSNKEFSENEKQILADLHYSKIVISDAIYVVNVNGYIGTSTNKEIEYAKKLGKEVMYLEPIK